MESSTNYEQHARELEIMVSNHPIVRSVTMSVLALVRHHSSLKPVSNVAQREVWWPFIKNCWMDLCLYGFCAYTRKSRKGVVLPEHMPVEHCTISVQNTGMIILTPRFGKHANSNKEVKIHVYVSESPDYRMQNLRSPLARVLASFKRLTQLSTMTVEQENRITNPAMYLEDAVSRNGGGSIYESVTAENPDWRSSIPGLVMGAQDRANQFSRVDEYISGLQQALVDTINRDGDGQIGFDSLGMRQKKRKRINDTQVPLPQGRRAVWHNPANRSNVLLYEEHFQREVPWVFGFPLSFFENNQSRVASNFKLMESISIAALQTQAEVIDRMLSAVSGVLFGAASAVLDSPMRISLQLKEQSVDYEVGTAGKSVEPKEPSKDDEPK